MFPDAIVQPPVQDDRLLTDFHALYLSYIIAKVLCCGEQIGIYDITKHGATLQYCRRCMRSFDRARRIDVARPHPCNSIYVTS